MKTPTIDKILNDLQDTWGYTSEELADIRMQLLNFAFAATIDSEVFEEVYYSLELKPVEN